MKQALTAVALLLPAAAHAQSYRCAIPAQVETPRPDLPSDSQPKRVLAIGGYTLAITWAPQYCRGNYRDASAKFECASGNRFGFTLHGLWPDGEGKDWPQYCAATGLLDRATIRGALCATPSAQLLQHEWAKHGTCMGGTPTDYFGRSTKLYAKLRYPDMDRLSRRSLSAGTLAAAMARANPGLGADGMRVTAGKGGWLDEIWLCLDKQFRYTRCPAHQGGLAPSAPIKIWRGRR